MMLAKNNRLTSECFENVFASGKTISGPIGYIKIKQTDACAGVACVAPQADTKTSVDRSRIRRRGYAAVEEVLEFIPDTHGVIWFLDGSASDVDFSRLTAAFAAMIERSEISMPD